MQDQTAAANSSRPKGWRNLTIHRETDRPGTIWTWCVVIGLVVASLPLGAYIVQRHAYVRIGYEVDALRTERERLVEEQRRLRVERARLESLGSIERWARHDGGLVPPAEGSVLVVDEVVESRSSALIAEGARPR